MASSDMHWFSRLKAGLSKTSAKLGGGIVGVFTRRKLDAETLAELEELLIQADIGAPAAAKIVASFGKNRLDKDISSEEVKAALAQEIAKILEPSEQALAVGAKHKPHVILVVGVNGNGKTTTIGKLAHMLKGQGRSVMLCAADTFRAAAVEQLKIWGGRVGCAVIAGEANADAASVAYRALEEAKAGHIDALLIDSAGRLHNKANLMAELEKLIKVIKKLDPEAPHCVLQVLDATTGQNALAQVEAFARTAHVTELVVTKLDGTAKGGIIVAIAERFRLPIVAVGVGEGIEDLMPFSAADFARNLLG